LSSDSRVRAREPERLSGGCLRKAAAILCAHPVERIGDEPEHRRPDKGARRDQHYHLGDPYDRRYELRDQPSTQYEAEVAEDVLYLLHPLADQGYQLLRQRPPTQVLHAILPHDFLAPPPLLLRQLQVVA
jgi:hypothetical protein